MARRPQRRKLNPILYDVRRVTGPARNRYLPAVWTMLVHSYAAIGVPHRAPGELLADYPVWEVALDREGVPRSFSLFKRSTKGLKLTATGSDGSTDGRDTTKDAIPRSFFKKGVYGETSGAVEKIAARAGAPAVRVPYVPGVLNKHVQPVDATHYRRTITGLGEHTKTLMGHPKGVPAKGLTEAPLQNPRKRKP